MYLNVTRKKKMLIFIISFQLRLPLCSPASSLSTFKKTQFKYEGETYVSTYLIWRGKIQMLLHTETFKEKWLTNGQKAIQHMTRPNIMWTKQLNPIIEL